MANTENDSNNRGDCSRSHDLTGYASYALWLKAVDDYLKDFEWSVEDTADEFWRHYYERGYSPGGAAQYDISVWA